MPSKMLTAGRNCPHKPRSRPPMICRVDSGVTSNNSITPLSRSRRKLPAALAAMLIMINHASVICIPCELRKKFRSTSTAL